RGVSCDDLRVSALPIGSSHLALPRCVFFVDRTSEQDTARGALSQPSFPDDVRRTAEREAVEFGVEIGEYRGVVRSRGAFSSACSRSSPPPSGASKPTTYSGRGLRALPR